MILFHDPYTPPVTEQTDIHCDTLDGPVVKDARVALDTGDVNSRYRYPNHMNSRRWVACP